MWCALTVFLGEMRCPSARTHLFLTRGAHINPGGVIAGVVDFAVVELRPRVSSASNEGWPADSRIGIDSNRSHQWLQLVNLRMRWSGGNDAFTVRNDCLICVLG